jgi:hypothetical protein
METEHWREVVLVDMWWGITNGATKEPPMTALWLTKLIATEMTQELDQFKKMTSKPSRAG